MTAADVIAALTARLGPPSTAGTFLGNPVVSWGRCAYLSHGVECFTHADGSTRVDVWQPISGIPMRQLIVDGADAPFSTPLRSAVIPRFPNVAAVDAYDGILWPAIVPLDVAVDVAARAMTGAR